MLPFMNVGVVLQKLQINSNFFVRHKKINLSIDSIYQVQTNYTKEFEQIRQWWSRGESNPCPKILISIYLQV